MACIKCGSNSWDKKRVGFYLNITCNDCGQSFEVELPERITEDSLCRDCLGKLEKKEAKITKKKLERKFLYSHYLECVKCHKKYWLPKYQIKNKDVGILDLVMTKKDREVKRIFKPKVKDDKREYEIPPVRNKGFYREYLDRLK